jgi:hypothetical protein
MSRPDTKFMFEAEAIAHGNSRTKVRKQTEVLRKPRIGPFVRVTDGPACHI